jgi:hypothetical protein
MPSDGQPDERDLSRGTSAETGSVDASPTGTELEPKAQAKIVPAEMASANTQSAGRESSDSPEVKPGTPAEAIVAVEGRLFWSLLGRGLIIAMITHFVYRFTLQLRRYPDNSYSDVPLLPLPGMRWLRFRVEIEDDFATFWIPTPRIMEKFARRHLGTRQKLSKDQAFLLMRFLIILSEGVAAALTILFVSPYYIIWAGLRALSATFRLEIFNAGGYRAGSGLRAVLCRGHEVSRWWRADRGRAGPPRAGAVNGG